MTEAEWLSATDTKPMVEHLQGRVSSRKMRLLAVACCERMGWVMSDAAMQESLLATERYADGWEKRSVMVRYGQEIARGRDPWVFNHVVAFTAQAVAEASRPGIALDACSVIRWVIDACEKGGVDPVAEQVSQTAILRDIFGNPFCPVALDPSWLTSTAVAIAEGVYAEKAFDRLPILADALQDTGCENADILSHLRSDGPHVKGCWALDLVLGKE